MRMGSYEKVKHRPIIRIYAESTNAHKANELAERFISELQSLI